MKVSNRDFTVQRIFIVSPHLAALLQTKLHITGHTETAVSARTGIKGNQCSNFVICTEPAQLGSRPCQVSFPNLPLLPQNQKHES
jgi:hypothetical protein